MAADAPELLRNAAPSSEGWLSYAFNSPHFGVAWRPLTVLSFSLDMALGGLSVGVLRGTDFILHMVAALGVFAVGLRLGKDRRIAWFALALYLAHPLLDDIVPFMPRRCYTMCAAFCLPAMGIALAPQVSFGRGLLVGLLFALGLASHEIASFFLFGTLVLSWAMDQELTFKQRLVRVTWRLLPGSILAGLLLVARGMVLGRVGGYDTKGRTLPVTDLLEFLGQGLFAVTGGQALVMLSALLVLFLVRAVSGTHPGRAMGWAFLAWILVAGGILAAQGVWFPRIAYSMLPIIALAVAWLMVQPGANFLRVGAALLCLPFLFASPLLHGPDGPRQELRGARAGLIAALEDAAARVLETSDQPAVLRLVLPFHRGDGEVRGRGQSAGRVLPRDARQPWRWVQEQLNSERILLEPWLYIEEPSIPWSSPAQVEQGGGSMQLVLPLDREVLSMGVSTARRRPIKNGSRQTWVPSRKHKQRRQFLFVYGPGGGELIEP